MGGIFYVVNKTSSPIHVFVSNYTGGTDDSWHIVPENSRQVWYDRTGWETVGIKVLNDGNQRGGVYAPVGSIIFFNGDFKKIEAR